MHLNVASCRAQDDLDVSAELPQQLPAGPARRSRLFRIGHDGDCIQCALPFGNGFQHSHSLGAGTQTIGSAFDVTTAEDVS